MAALYSVGAHPLLSAEASTLAEDELDAQAVTAERVLGFRNAELLTGDEADEAAGYVALQVNFQVRNGARADVVAESKGSQSIKYAEAGGRRVPVDPIAEAGAARLVEQLPPVSVTDSATLVW